MMPKQPIKKLKTFEAIEVLYEWKDRNRRCHWDKPIEWVIDELKEKSRSGMISYHGATKILKEAETCKLSGNANRGMDWIRAEWRKITEPTANEKLITYTKHDLPNFEHQKEVLKRMGQSFRVTVRGETIRLYIRGPIDKEAYEEAERRVGLPDGWVAATATVKNLDQSWEIEDWCNSYVGSLDVEWRWGLDLQTYFFRDEADAVTFKLRWG